MESVLDTRNMIKVKTPHITPPTFSGSNIPIDRFLEQYEQIATLNAWSEQLMLHYLPVYLQGWAETVYYNAKTANPTITWSQMKDRLLEFFQPSFATNELKLIDMLQRYQGSSEPVMQYYTEKMAMIYKLGMHFSEEEICRFIVLGLTPDIIEKFIMTEGVTSSLVNLERALIKFVNAKLLAENQAKRQRATAVGESNVLLTNPIAYTPPYTHPPILQSDHTDCYQISEVPVDNYHINTNPRYKPRQSRKVKRRTKARRNRAQRSQNSYCFVCGKEDHTAKYCKHRFNGIKSPEGEQHEPNIIHSLVSSVNPYDSNIIYKRFVSYIKVELGKSDMLILLDTGAGRSVISRTTMLSLNLPFEKSDTYLKLFSASGHRLEIAGKACIPCKVEGVEFMVEFLVIENLKTIALLGMNTLRDLSAILNIGQGTCTLEKNGTTIKTHLALSAENKDIAYLSGTYEVEVVNKLDHKRKVRFSDQNQIQLFDESEQIICRSSYETSKNTKRYNQELWLEYRNRSHHSRTPDNFVKAPEFSEQPVKSILKKSVSDVKQINRENEVRENFNRECISVEADIHPIPESAPETVSMRYQMYSDLASVNKPEVSVNNVNNNQNISEIRPTSTVRDADVSSMSSSSYKSQAQAALDISNNASIQDPSSSRNIIASLNESISNIDDS
uniref:Uncharacterized protein n=1 Tax=Cacopsylla melanoneura TaxID=428564 RepID=A0A8D9E5D3_9HEMI